MRALTPILAAALVILLALAAMADDGPLAPLVPQEGKEGTREAYLTFTYRKTVEERSETTGGQQNIGADKLHDRKTIQTSGRAVLVVQDHDYLNLRILKEDGPNGTIIEMPLPEYLHINWMASEPVAKLGVKSYSRQVRVNGRRLQEHFAVNTWGEPEPGWARHIVDSNASVTMNWTGERKPKSGELDTLYISVSSQDPEASFSFNFSSGCDFTKEEWFVPVKWSDHHYRDLVPTHTTASAYERAEAYLPTWSDDKSVPPDDDVKRWTRVITRTKTGLLVKATRSKTNTTPADGKFLGATIKTDEQLDIQFDQEASDYEILITPPQRFRDWIPKAGVNEHTVGDKLNFKGRIHRIKGKAAADREVGVNVELTSSRVPGLCMNSPRTGGKDPDLKILKVGTTDKFKVEQPVLENEQATQQAHGKFKVDEEFNIVVGCYDYGPIGGISFGGTVPVRIEGFEPKVHLGLPLDDNENHVADAWERQEGVYEKNLPADWDDVATPGQKHNGDGICLYERYRGFKNDVGGYDHLKCDHKYIFIYDPGNILRKRGSDADFKNASQVTPWFISQDQWTGRGSQQQQKRIVNFNHEGPECPSGRHRVAQHALHIVEDGRRQEQGKDVPPPPGWQRAYTAAGVTIPPPQEGGGATLGYAWPDCLPKEKFGRSPLDKYQISIYTDTISNYAYSFALDAMPGATDSAQRQALTSYDTTHKGEFEDQVERLLRWILTHELGHCVGAQHHVPIYGGDSTCYMRYPTRESYSPQADDPYWVRYEHYPNAFCRGSSVRPTDSCYQDIQVTDYREGR
jgi:hypothetical protein